MLTFIHISDTHITSDGAAFHGVDPVAHLRAFVAQVNAFPQPPDFVLHTGDVSNDQGATSYQRAASALSDLAVPLVVVNGNHDSRAWLRSTLDAPADPGGDPAALLDYSFEVNGERFLVLDAATGLVRDPLGRLTDAQLERVRADATPDGPPLTVCVHYPVFPMGSPWLDDNMLLTNGADLHAALLPARDRLRGVFCGHLHRSSQIIRDGITYTSAPSLTAGYMWWPWTLEPLVDTEFPAAYNLVQYRDDQVTVQQYALPLPG